MKQIFKLSLIIFFLTTLLTSDLVRAADYNLEEAEQSGVLPWYNPGATVCSSGSTGSSGGTLIGNDNLEKIYNYFLGKGLTDFQAAGIVGNISQESGGDPTIAQTGGNVTDPSIFGTAVGVGKAWGLIQWDAGGRAIVYAKQAGITGDIAELSTQLDLIWWHLEKETPTYQMEFIKTYKETSSVEEAVVTFHDGVEGAGIPVMENRLAAARLALEQYGSGSSVTTGVSVNASTGCTCVAPITGSTSGVNDYGLTEQMNQGLMHPFAVEVAILVGNQFGVQSIGGYRVDAYHEHDTGKVVDIMMVGSTQEEMKQFGDPIFEYLKANAAQFKIESMIWQQKYYLFNADGTPGNSAGPNGWNNELMEDRGSITQNHYDHIHLNMGYIETGDVSPTGMVDVSSNCQTPVPVTDTTEDEEKTEETEEDLDARQ